MPTYIGLILAPAVIAYLVLRAGFEALPFRLPLDHEPALLAGHRLVAAVAAVAPLGLPFLRSRAGRCLDVVNPAPGAGRGIHLARQARAGPRLKGYGGVVSTAAVLRCGRKARA